MSGGGKQSIDDIMEDHCMHRMENDPAAPRSRTEAKEKDRAWLKERRRREGSTGPTMCREHNGGSLSTGRRAGDWQARGRCVQ